MQVYLSVTPQEYQEAAGPGRSFAHTAYRIGENSSLLRQQLLVQTRGGILAITDRNAPPVENPEALAAAALRECARRRYEGILLDFDGPVRQDLAELVRQLDRKCGKLYIPKDYASVAERAQFLLCTAISGGNLSRYLQEAMQHSQGRIALDVQRLRMDFSLPAETGSGVPLTGSELRQLMEQEHPSIFFSKDLCARYFTYIREHQLHFVLFDDADTLRQKLRSGASLGMSAAFLMWPEVRDLADQLFPRPRG